MSLPGKQEVRMTRHTERYRPSATSQTGTPPTLVGTVVTSRDELETYAVEWNELLLSSDANTVFLTWEWISAWLEAIGKRSKQLLELTPMVTTVLLRSKLIDVSEIMPV